MADDPALAIVIVAHDSAQVLGATLDALGRQLAPADEMVVVDCASTDDPARSLAGASPATRLVRLEENLGFAGGAHVGAQETVAPLLLFLNPDARPEPGCLDALRTVATQRPDWSAWQALVMLPDGARINTSGGIVHWLGIAWAGDCGAPVAHAGREPRPVAFASGAALVVRRKAWDHSGGLDPAYFMYSEDVDLSLRLWLAGEGVGVAPAARVEHAYEFAKGDYKWFYLERNRLRTVLSVYPARLLALLAPALVVFELALLAVAAGDGWLAAKLRADCAVLRDARRILHRRRRVQASRRVTPAAFAGRLSASLDSPYLGPAARVRPLATGQRLYWRIVERALAL